MKRKRRSRACDGPRKQIKTIPEARPALGCQLLSLYYPHVQSLRSYLCDPKSSRRRCKRIEDHVKSSGKASGLEEIFDRTLVGSFDPSPTSPAEDANKGDFKAFSQEVFTSTATTVSSQGSLSISEIVDFVIWRLFRRHSSTQRPPHILCHGFSRACMGGVHGYPASATSTIPGIMSYSHNEYVDRLKSKPWRELTSLLGRRGEARLIDLLLDGGIFASVGDCGKDFVQISGTPLADLPPLATTETRKHGVKEANGPPRDRKPASIKFVRHRMFYARPSLSSRGRVTFGLPPIHVLNRKRNPSDMEETVHVARYIFPRSFGLHNVFTSTVDGAETAQPFKDYTLREQEIKRNDYDRQRTAGKRGKSEMRNLKLPKRLRGRPIDLITALRKRHFRCSYGALLDHYCKVPGEHAIGQQSVFDSMTPSENVSAFCRAAVNNVFPSAFWGEGEDGESNRSHIMRSVDTFVKLRRYESMSLHLVMEDVKISALHWLDHPQQQPHAHMSRTDLTKRTELLMELVYYLFDSFLLPLISSCFYVTESSVHRNELCFFRHDVWRTLSEPALSSLKANMFEELDPRHSKQLLSRRTLGTSRVRLLPKETGLRPLMNLRRRVLSKTNGKMVLGRSINAVLAPAFSVLNFEKSASPQRLGASLFSVDDIFPRLQHFRAQLARQGWDGRPLYFAKVDVQACFDTIPQAPVMQLVRNLIETNTYSIGRYSEGRVIGQGPQARAAWKFHSKAKPFGEGFGITDIVSGRDVKAGPGSVLIDSVLRKQEGRSKILALMQEHLEQNVVQLGKTLYRQKEGIPQGSIVSSLLCNFYYAELERKMLGFVQSGQSLLLRLIDDFLLITTCKATAEKFVKIMHAGLPEYGVTVKREKSRINFAMGTDGQGIARTQLTTDFSYCGLAINTATLNITKDKERRYKSNVSAALTVEYSKLPGQSFYRKTLNMLKLHMHAMLLSTAFNRTETVLGNLYHGLTDLAARTLHYMGSMKIDRQPGWRLVIRTIDDLVNLAFTIMKRGRGRRPQETAPYECAITKAQLSWLAYRAFHAVFHKRQTKHQTLLAWLQYRLDRASVACGSSRQTLSEVTQATHT